MLSSPWASTTWYAVHFHTQRAVLSSLPFPRLSSQPDAKPTRRAKLTIRWQFVSAGNSASIIGAASDFDQTFTYCGNVSYSYDYSAEYQYGSPPKCRELSTGEATVKDTGNFFFVTMFDERHTIGWSCNGPEAASQYQKCLDLASYYSPELGSGDLESNIVSKTRGNQCTCNVRESYYPVGVEHMKMAMEVSYGTSMLFGKVNGSTNNPNPELTPQGRSLEVRLYNSTGHNLLKDRVTPPLTDWIAFSLKDLLTAVGERMVLLYPGRSRSRPISSSRRL